MGLEDTLQTGAQVYGPPWPPRIRMPQPQPDAPYGGVAPAVSASDAAQPTPAATVPMGTSTELPYLRPDPVDTSRLHDLEGQQAAARAPEPMKSRVIRALMEGGAMVAGGAFGGLPGAAGAGRAVEDIEGGREKQREFNISELGKEVGQESGQVSLAERLRQQQMMEGDRERMAAERLTETERQNAARDALTAGHYGAEAAHWKAEEAAAAGKPEPFNLEREMANAMATGDTERLSLLKRVQSTAHPVQPPASIIMPNATGGIGGVYEPQRGGPGRLVAPPDQSAAPNARKSAEPSVLANRDIQAGIVTNHLKTVESFIDSNKDMLGPIQGRVQTIEQLWGDPSPQAMKIRSMVEAHLSLIPALHGMRSFQMVNEFVKQYGKLKFTPEALKGALEGISSAAPAVQQGIEGVYGSPTGGGEGGVIDFRDIKPR